MNGGSGPGNEVPSLPYSGTERLLTDDERLRAARWINGKAKAKNDSCLVCGGRSLIAPSLINMPGGVAADGFSPWSYPCVATICVECGFTRYFNAFVMGLLAPPSDRPERAYG